MDDEDGPTITDSFYEHLFRGHTHTQAHDTHPKTTDATFSLHHAVSKLRMSCPFKRWVQFIHMGL